MMGNGPVAKLPAEAAPAGRGGEAADVGRQPVHERAQPLGVEVVRHPVGGKDYHPARARRFGRDPPVVDAMRRPQRQGLVSEGIRVPPSEGRHASVDPADDGESVSKAREQQTAAGFPESEDAGARALGGRTGSQFETPEDLHEADEVYRVHRRRRPGPEPGGPPQRPARRPCAGVGGGP